MLGINELTQLNATSDEGMWPCARCPFPAPLSLTQCGGEFCLGRVNLASLHLFAFLPCLEDSGLTFPYT